MAARPLHLRFNWPDNQRHRKRIIFRRRLGWIPLRLIHRLRIEIRVQTKQHLKQIRTMSISHFYVSTRHRQLDRLSFG